MDDWIGNLGSILQFFKAPMHFPSLWLAFVVECLIPDLECRTGHLQLVLNRAPAAAFGLEVP